MSSGPSGINAAQLTQLVMRFRTSGAGRGSIVYLQLVTVSSTLPMMECGRNERQNSRVSLCLRGQNGLKEREAAVT